MLRQPGGGLGVRAKALADAHGFTLRIWYDSVGAAPRTRSTLRMNPGACARSSVTRATPQDRQVLDILPTAEAGRFLEASRVRSTRWRARTRRFWTWASCWKLRRIRSSRHRFPGCLSASNTAFAGGLPDALGYVRDRSPGRSRCSRGRASDSLDLMAGARGLCSQFGHPRSIRFGPSVTSTPGSTLAETGRGDHPYVRVTQHVGNFCAYRSRDPEFNGQRSRRG